jgi:hypothetical protein
VLSIRLGETVFPQAERPAGIVNLREYGVERSLAAQYRYLQWIDRN